LGNQRLQVNINFRPGESARKLARALSFEQQTRNLKNEPLEAQKRINSEARKP
jgi:hypothetical protein